MSEDPLYLHREMRELVNDVIARNAIIDSDQPHCYISIDPETNMAVVTGPFANEHEAAHAMEEYRQKNSDMDPPFILRTAMMFTPEGNTPRMTQDREVGAKYIHVAPGEVFTTIPVTAQINVDLSKDGALVGVELLEGETPTEVLSQRVAAAFSAVSQISDADINLAWRAVIERATNDKED